MSKPKVLVSKILIINNTEILLLKGARFQPLKTLRKLVESKGYICLGKEYLHLIKEKYPDEVYSGRIVALAQEEKNGHGKEIYPTLCQVKDSPQHIGEVTTTGKASWYRIIAIKKQ